MKQRTKILACLFGNFLIFCFVSIFCLIEGENSKYYTYGPNDSLIIISIKINDWKRYIILLITIGIMNSFKVIVEEIGMPVLGFSIYNPDKKEITEFGKLELQIYGNLMFLFSSLRNVFSILLIVSQIDISIFSVLIDNMTTIFTIRLLLNEKKFIKRHKDENFILLNNIV
jgi:hypothetical protein